MKVLRKILKAALKSLLWIFILQITLIFTLKYVPVRTTSYMMLKSAKHYLKTGEKLKLYRKWVSNEQICFEMKFMIIHAEDVKFMQHYGFNFENIRRAVKINSKNKMIVWGGSTITQQTARNVFLYPKRSFFRKALEAEITVLLELIWGKSRIMEVYLNTMEMGENIYGVESCAEIVFGKTAKTLTPEQCAMVACMLPYEPKNYSCPFPTSRLVYDSLLLEYDSYIKNRH